MYVGHLRAWVIFGCVVVGSMMCPVFLIRGYSRKVQYKDGFACSYDPTVNTDLVFGIAGSVIMVTNIIIGGFFAYKIKKWAQVCFYFSYYFFVCFLYVVLSTKTRGYKFLSMRQKKNEKHHFPWIF